MLIRSKLHGLWDYSIKPASMYLHVYDRWCTWACNRMKVPVAVHSQQTVIIDGTNFGKVEKTNGIETLVLRQNSKFQLKKEIEDSMVGNKSLKIVENYIGKVQVMNNVYHEINWELFKIVSRERSTNQSL